MRQKTPAFQLLAKGLFLTIRSAFLRDIFSVIKENFYRRAFRDVIVSSVLCGEKGLVVAVWPLYFVLVFFYIKKFSCAFCQKPHRVRRNFCIKKPGKKWFYSFYIVRQGRFFLYLCPFAGALSRSVGKKERFAFLVPAKIEISACFLQMPLKI